MNSGAITGNFASGPVATNTASVAKAVNCTDDPDSDATLDCLRDVPFETLLPAALDLAKKVSPPDGIGAFRPVIDGDFIPDQPSKLIKQGSFVKGSPSYTTPQQPELTPLRHLSHSRLDNGRRQHFHSRLH